MKVNKESFGIPNYGSWYIKTNGNQNEFVEMIKIHSFIEDVLSGKEFEDIKNFEFINYGSTQLVYVASTNTNKKYTLLVSQPVTEFGVVKKEFDNLIELSKENSNVVKPILYSTNEEQELYVTPYEYQARCIGVDEDKWGIWVPEPEYHFKDFEEKEKYLINTTMIALLIKFYDAETKTGIAKCRLDGGDFMLKKDYSNKKISRKNILENIMLIAARDKIHLELDEYILLLDMELSNEIETNRIIGKKLKESFTTEEIEDGIELGLQLRKNIFGDTNKLKELHKRK